MQAPVARVRPAPKSTEKAKLASTLRKPTLSISTSSTRRKSNIEPLEFMPHLVSRPSSPPQPQTDPLEDLERALQHDSPSVFKHDLLTSTSPRRWSDDDYLQQEQQQDYSLFETKRALAQDLDDDDRTLFTTSNEPFDKKPKSRLSLRNSTALSQARFSNQPKSKEPFVIPSSSDDEDAKESAKLKMEQELKRKDKGKQKRRIETSSEEDVKEEEDEPELMVLGLTKAPVKTFKTPAANTSFVIDDSSENEDYDDDMSMSAHPRNPSRSQNLEDLMDFDEDEIEDDDFDEDDGEGELGEDGLPYQTLDGLGDSSRISAYMNQFEPGASRGSSSRAVSSMGASSSSSYRGRGRSSYRGGRRGGGGGKRKFFKRKRKIQSMGAPGGYAL
jgi:hypothetical protein